jgi:4-amino-4-deoxy-L-arabinose transferase-like glycosyltransferase
MNRAEIWFKSFILLHLIAWTLLAVLVRHNLPMDAIEGAIWGQHLDWGYDKNPYLNAWLTALAAYVDNHSGLMIYLFSQISVIACFWAVWQLAKLFLPPVYALVSVIILESMQYYNFHAIDFNDNTLELSLWALAIYFFYCALQTPSRLAWLFTGLFTGLGLMAKYYTGVLITCMALFLLSEKANRQKLLSPWPYAGLLIFLLITLPHVFWLPHHDYITINYVFDRAKNEYSWTNHLFYPAQFAWEQLQVFLPALILFALLFIGKKPFFARHAITLSAYNKKFLFYMGIGPLLLTLLISFLFGITLRAGWGMPLLSLWGIILISLLPPYISKEKFYRFIAGIILLSTVFLTGSTVSLVNSTTPSSANFPGKELAQSITQLWRDQYHSKLEYVAGSRWLGGNISFYSSDHPAVFMEWDKQRSPWIDIKDLQQKGGIFIWDISKNETLPAAIKTQFPQLNIMPPMEFAWQRNRHQLPPIKIGIAVLAPHN